MSTKPRKYSDPPDKNFGNVTCESLTVKNNKGGEISLSFTDAGHPVFRLSREPKGSAVAIFTGANGGVIAVFGEDGNVRIESFVGEDGIGYVLSGSKSQRSTAVLPPEVL